MKRVSIAFLVAWSLAAAPANGEPADSPEPADAVSPADKPGTTVTGQWFLLFRAGRSGGDPFSRFSVERGYINVQHRLSDRIGGRITPDVSVDRDGDGEGDLEMRLKYCYVELLPRDLAFFHRPRIEFGLVHRPWLDFEESVTGLRVQGPMYLERHGVMNSGDFGVAAFALLGPPLREGAGAGGPYAGRWGSLAIGICNGGGYHAIERNDNKTVEGRLTVRPLFGPLPGLQLSYHGIVGDGNAVEAPPWTVNQAHIALAAKQGSLAGQYFRGEGNSSGDALDGNGAAEARSGYSIFGEARIGSNGWSVVARHDSFDRGRGDAAVETRTILAGVAKRVDERARFLVDYERTTTGSWSDPAEEAGSFRTEFRF